MADKIRLATPLLGVVMADGATWVVQAVNFDLVRWDKTRIKQRPPWPLMQDAPLWWQSYLAWSASSREGLTNLKWEEWELPTGCASVESLDKETPDYPPVGEAGTPYPPEVGPE